MGDGGSRENESSNTYWGAHNFLHFVCFHFNNWFKIPKRMLWYVIMPILHTEITKFQGGMDLPKVIKLISVRSEN